jgi:hypothetical protein
MQKNMTTNEDKQNIEFLTIFSTHSYHKYGTLFTKSTHSSTLAQTKSSYESHITKV